MVRKQRGEKSVFATDPLGVVMKTPVRWKKNKTRPITVRDTIARVVRPRPAPEVLVKIKRGGKTQGHIKAHLEYITRNGRLDGETERGEIIQGRDQVYDVLREWTTDAASVKPGARNTINAIFSMPPGTDSEGVKAAVREFARDELSEHKYLFVLHEDEAHPHVHISIRTLSINGKKLDPRKEDLQLWREVFAEKLREQGIDAKATYRPSRGVVEKPLSMAQYKAKNWEAEQSKAASASPLRAGVRDLPGKVFTAIMDRDIQTYAEFLDLLKPLGQVERRAPGTINEHLSVKPGGAQRAALLKDFVFTREFIELPPEAKRAALAARLDQPKGLNYGKYTGRTNFASDRASTFARVRDNLGAAETHLRAAGKAAGRFDEASRQLTHRRVVEAVAAFIQGRSGSEAKGIRHAADTRGVTDGTFKERGGYFERATRNIGQAGDNLDAIGRTHRSFDTAAGEQFRRATLRAISAIVQGYGRDRANDTTRAAPGTGAAGAAGHYLTTVLAPRRPYEPKVRSEREIRTYAQRVEDAARSLAGTPAPWRSTSPKKNDPWAEQEVIRASWMKVATDLRQSGSTEDVELAGEVESFVKRMPAVQTQQQRIAARLIALRQTKQVAPAGKGAAMPAPSILQEDAGIHVDIQNHPGRER